MLEKLKNILIKSSVQDKCILVVEDNKVDSKLLLSILDKKYSTVLLAEDAKTGLKIARMENPDLIILDYNLPDSKGGEVLSELKSNDATKRIPVLILTAERTPANICDSFINDAERFIEKPIDRKELLAEINKRLK